MSTRARTIDIPVDGQHIDGTLVGPDTLVPGVLLVHGWDGSQEQYTARAHEIAAMGCICLTFDLRGHVRHQAERDTVTREDNLRDLLCAYDVLVGHPSVDPRAVAIVGSSYGGYLAAIASSLRPVRWLGLRVPALYEDEDWDRPKNSLDRERLKAYRNRDLPPDANRALVACTQFKGDVLIVESEHDDLVPHPVIQNYKKALAQAQSVTYRVIAGADHALSKKEWQQNYTSLLVHWMTEMVLNARAGRTSPAAQMPLARSAQATPQD
ncbi:alpha/beta hydrolase family protein [Ramlibacter albus]|uniref:Alpha/beta fold hydrolase n=1 Tax=Ramlibacter albus TaxID=2079448 RepID=A0A923MC18_9BURK|nr:alpha/beta fold hydrolase [Ramlibacter albus]MBC5768027.1 alpha/beta fold hydrolase [Ramlibacter albus]